MSPWLKKLIAGGAATAVGCALFAVMPSTTSAGQAMVTAVVITGSTAEGSMWGARQGPGPNIIGCAVYNTVGTSLAMGCSATNSAGQSLSCFSTAAHMVTAAASVDLNSYIYFTVNSSGGCSAVTIFNDSIYLP